MFNCGKSHVQKTKRHDLILKQFPKSIRRHLLLWVFRNQEPTRTAYHRTYLQSLEDVRQYGKMRDLMDRKSQIAYSLLEEFGHQFSERRIFMTLIDEIDRRLARKALDMVSVEHN